MVAFTHGSMTSRFESYGSLSTLCWIRISSKYRSGESSSFSMVFYFEFSGTPNLKTQIRDYITFSSVFYPFTRFVRSQDATLP